MKKWMQKLVDQFEFDWPEDSTRSPETKSDFEISEDRATLLYFIDTYNKHLVEIDSQPVRKVREVLDQFAKELVNPNSNMDRVLFRFRQFFSSYRIDEYTYVQKTFDDFRGIIWDFIDQLSEDLCAEKKEDDEINKSLEMLREAVEANSIDSLKNQARSFIDEYMEHQSNREDRRSRRMSSIKRNLALVKKQLSDANIKMRKDHLTNAYNRQSFDEQLNQVLKMTDMAKTPLSLISLDIDHFKKFNDTYGHAVGDYILVECVKMLKESFDCETAFVARVGGEEFNVLLPGKTIEEATAKAKYCLSKIRGEVFLKDDLELKFTVSMGIAQYTGRENKETFLKRADDALYESKNTGRNKFTISNPKNLQVRVA